MKKLVKSQREKLTQVSTTKTSNHPAKISIAIHLPSDEHAETIFKALLPETLSQPRKFRSRTTVNHDNRILKLNIVADDITAMRAASNTYLGYVTVALKTLKAVSPFYRRAEARPDSPDILERKS